jgi:C4-dicarboxylate-specific signal transduction histidine kinase
MTAQVIGSSDVDAGKLPAVLGDRVHLQQVLLNLILNGLDALSWAGGEYRSISLTARLS